MIGEFVAFVALSGLGVYLWTIMLVGQARQRYGIPAPATSGHPQFERTFRVQMNTLEQLPLFLGGLLLSASFVAEWLAALLGLAWIAGRVLYAIGYIEAPERRGVGFLISGGAALAMLVLSAIGILWSLVT